ncbi:MAG: class I mannose-6-phosphate isomerase [Acidobacteriaceae bacterium]|nr:class I mannose-6-phosphate isomerase [Acidobacteriaceae bacterium]
MSPNSPGPLVLEPILTERIWGVQVLPAPYPQPEPGKPVGELWLTSLECRVQNGGSAGKTLGAMMPDFPLLMKVLLPKDKLSVQVHPNDEQAKAIGEARGKTECWYVLQADPGAEIALGLKPGVMLEDLPELIAEGSMEEKLQMVPVKAGDMIFVDAGTVHAIGPGVVVLETQQYSDITYRLFDYGRPRELHVQQALAVTRTGTSAGLVLPESMGEFTRLISCKYFVVDRFEMPAGKRTALRHADKLQILIAMEEGVTLRGGGAEIPLPRGKAVVLPLGSGEFVLEAREPGATMRVLQP